MIYYFAYGSNMNPQRMIDRGVKFESYELAHLEHYKMRSNKVSKKFQSLAFVNVEPCFEESVFGVLYRLSPNADLSDLDKKEGYPIHYQKTFVPVETSTGTRMALIYIATRNWACDVDKPMSDEYKSLISAGLNVCEDLLMSGPVNETTESGTLLFSKITTSLYEYIQMVEDRML